jgi:hypothetical protein
MNDICVYSIQTYEKKISHEIIIAMSWPIKFMMWVGTIYT